MAVDVRDPERVLHAPVLNLIVDGRAVLGDIDRRKLAGVAVAQHSDDLRQTLRHDRPVECAAGYVLDGHLLEAKGVARIRTADQLGSVVVDAEEVDGSRDELGIAFPHDREVGPEIHLLGIEWVLAQEDRVHELPVAQAGVALGRGRIARVVRIDRPDRREVVGDSDHPVNAGGAQGADRHPMSEQQVVHDWEDGQRHRPAGSRGPEGVPVERVDCRLVERDPGGDAIAQLLGQDSGVLAEPLGGVANGPTAFVLESLGQVPVEEGDVRGHPALEQAVHQPVIEVEAARFDRAGAGGHDSRPGHGEAISVDAERRHQVEVGLPAVVMVASDVAGRAVADQPWRVGERVPHRRPLAVLVPRALDLVRGGGDAPPEPCRKERKRSFAWLQDELGVHGEI